MRWYYWVGLIVLAVAIGAYMLIQSRLSSPLLTDARLEGLRAAAAAEDETAFSIPEPRANETPPANPLNNVYFGELHVHSNLSFDAFIFGNRSTPDAAYRFE